jgi:serine/threonine-protein kinase
VLVEAVTGTVPAVADTAIGTLAARTHTPLVAPLALGRLGPVVERAGRPDPAERYPDAATMRAALADAARALPPPQPLALAGLGGEIDGGPPTQIGRSSNLFDQDAPVAPPVVVDEHVEAAPARRRRAPGAVRWISYAVIAAILLALIGGGIAIAAVSTQAGTVAAPSLVGLTQTKATDAVSATGLSLKIVTRTADDPADVVIAQDPAPGTFVSDGGTVTLVVSRGPPPVTIPDVSAQSPADAEATLEAQGFVVDVKRQYDENVPADAVIGTDPPGGAKLARDSTLSLLVSDGPAPVPVPDVSKKTYDQAAAQLSAAGFTPSRDDVFSDTVPKDQVIGTDPPAGQGANRGATIVVQVSKGPEMVTVPDLVGKSLEAAQAQLQAAGFEVDTQSYLPGRLVRAQSPAAGTSVNKGTKVTLFF